MKFDKLALRTEIIARSAVLKTLRVQLTQSHTEDSPQLQFAAAYGAQKVTVLLMALAHSRGKVHRVEDTLASQAEILQSILSGYRPIYAHAIYDLKLDSFLASEEVEQIAA